MRKHLATISLAAALGASGAASAQTADAVLVNGNVVTLDGKSSVVQGIAIRDGKVLATGSNEEVRKLAGPNTRVVDAGGRTVVPGLVDSHIHAIRAGLTYSVEASWIGVPSLAKGLELIREAARGSKPDQWIKVGGGWTEMQFPEKRGPTVEELAAAAPDRKVYVQRLYNTAWITPPGIKAMNLTADTQIPAGKAEKDAAGNLTGVVTGVNATFNFLTAKLPRPTFAEQVQGTKKYFRELNRLGLTGIHDVMGGGMFPQHYGPLQEVWRKGELTVRVAYRQQAQIRGKEFETLQDYTKFLPQGFGDDKLRFVGFGEQITAAMFDGSTVGLIFNPSDQDKEDYYKVVRWAAERGYSVHQHASTDKAANLILDAFERVNKDVPIASLRWQITHVEDARDETLERMKALGVGWSVQDRLLYAGQTFLKVLGPEAAKRAPPIQSGLKLGLRVAAGTDSDQVAPYNPFVSIRWLLDGKAIDGTPLRGPEQSPSREDALRMYSINAAWFAFADDKQGSLEPGKYADLAVLSGDYLTVPVERVGELHSLLTLVGGKAVYGEGAFASLEGKL